MTTMRLAILAFLVPAAALAQNAPPRREISTDFGLVDVSGNTSTSTFTANERFVRRLTYWEFKQDFGVVYGKTNDVRSSEQWRASVRADYGLTKRFALYALTAWDRNEFAGIEKRFAEGVGGSQKLIASEKDQLNLEGGLQLTQQDNVTGAYDAFSALRIASSFKHAFSKTAYFLQAVEVLPNLEEHDDVRVNSETALVAPLSTHVAMKLSYVLRFDNVPSLNAAGTARLEKSDRILSAGIQVSY